MMNARLTLRAETLCHCLRQMKLNRFVDIGMFPTHLCVVNLDSKDYTGIVRVALPVEATDMDRNLYVSIDQTLLVKALECFQSGPVVIVPHPAQSYVLLTNGTREYRIPGSFGPHSQSLVHLNPAHGQTRDFHVILPTSLLRTLFRNLQAADTKALFSFWKSDDGLKFTIESANYHETAITPLSEVQELACVEPYAARTLAIPGHIGALLRLMTEYIAIDLYQDYVVLKERDGTCQIILPVSTTQTG